MKDILLSSEYEIIKFLALNGPSNRYEISKGTKIKYQTVYSAVKRLLKKLFIDVFDVGKARTNFDKPSYFITFIGKLAAMAITENNDDILDLIATSEPRQFYSFLILDEWEYICQSKVARDYVLSIIRTKFFDLLRIWDFKRWTHARNYRPLLLQSVLWEGFPPSIPRLNEYRRKPRSEILQFFMDNPRFRERIKSILLSKKHEAERINEEVEEVRRIYGLEMT